MFITIEGIDGSGKTTQIDKLQAWLDEMGRSIVITAEPAKYGQIGEDIYKIIKESKESNPACDLLLVYTLRNLHVRKVILPALSEGKVVICGRYIDSSIAYYAGTQEGYANALETVLFLHKAFAQNTMPNLTFLLDISAEVAMRRIASRGNGDRFDNMKVEQMEGIRQVFLSNARSDSAKSRTHIIDGTQEETKIFQDIVSIIKTKM